MKTNGVNINTQDHLTKRMERRTSGITTKIYMIYTRHNRDIKELEESQKNVDPGPRQTDYTCRQQHTR